VTTDKNQKPFFSPELLTDPNIPYDERRNQLLSSSKAFLAHHRERIKERHVAGSSGRLTVGSLTSLTDTLLRNLYHSVSVDMGNSLSGTCSLIAIGGYGRGELNPYSDVDILFYSGGRDGAFAQQVSERMLYLLWDLGFDVGYSVRSTKDCLDMADKDITARTALIDSRFLIGDETMYTEFERSVMTAILGRNTRSFIQKKISENERRLSKYGSTVYMLEPNIKEGEGGLRDLHTALWVNQVKFKARSLRELVMKGVLFEREAKSYEDALDYLWRIRNELHYLSPRKNDQINFDQQEKIAHFLGYRDNRRAPAVEQFMQDYYAHATVVEHLASIMINKVMQQEAPTKKFIGYLTRRAIDDNFYVFRGELRVTERKLFESEPAQMMTAFLLAQRHGVELSIDIKGLIRDNLHRINDKVRRSKIMSEGFLDILRNPRGQGEVLRDMHHLQFLNHFIPEFGRIYCKVQHDAYHVYTVDTHTLFAMEEIAKLWRGDYREKKPLLTQVANNIEKPELLLLAVLFHDIGKGEGKDHSNKGADMIPTIARRLGLRREDSQRLEFLVRNHLQMAHISQRRDLHDDRLISQFAQTMQMSENLHMLYLLTFADIKAVGPDVWSEWKGRLLGELYEKTYEVLERGNFSAEKRSEKVRNRKRKVVGLLEEDFGNKLVREVLRHSSTRYILSYRSAEIARQLRVVLGRGESPLAMKVTQDPDWGYTELMLSTLDMPGLFTLIAGVMTAHGVNILGAQIHTMNNGVALDILQVRSGGGELITDSDKWQRIENDLIAVIEGRVRVDTLVEKRERPSFMVERPLPRFPNRVEIDNEVSSEYSVIDIYAHDTVGLLYRICKTLLNLGLYIGVSRISTKVDQAADTFYVQDIFGQKIQDVEQIEQIKAELLAALSADDSEK